MGDGTELLRVEVVDDGASPADVYLRLAGELDISTAAQLGTALEEALAREPSRIILGCCELTFIDSSGLSLLVRAAGALASPSALVIQDPAPHVRRVLEVAGLDRILTVSP